MPEYNLEIGKLFIYNPKKSKSIVLSSFYKQKEGDLVMMGEIKPNNKENQKILELIFESFKNYYLSFVNLSGNQKKDDFTNLELYFENTLQKTNQELQLELIKKDKKEWLEKCSLIIAVIKDKMIHFTYLGKEMEIFLIRKNKIINILQDKLNDKINPLKIFTHIISGNLNNNDYLFISNSSLLDYFSQEKIKKAVLTYPPQKTCEHLKLLIGGELEPQISLIAVILKIIFKKEDKRPSFLIQEPEIYAAAPLIKRQNKIILFFKKVIYVKEKFFDLIKKTIKILQKCFSYCRPINFKLSLENLKTKYKLLSPYHKTIFLTCLFFLLLFIQSIAFLMGKQAAKKQTLEENNIKQEIQSKQSEVEVLLNYNNKEKAEKILEEITLLIQKLPSRTVAQKKIIADLKQNNQTKLNEVKGILEIQPETIVNLTSLKQDFEGQKMLLSDEIIYVMDFKNNTLSLNDLKNKNTSFIKINSKDLFDDAIFLDKKNLLLNTKNGKLFKFSLKDRVLTSFKIEVEREIQDLQIYQEKLYLLNKKDNQIFKYQKTSDGFVQETKWFKENIDLKDASSFSIDGSIYLLKENGQILKFYAGRKQNFEISNLKDDSLKPIKIFTNLEVDYIYLLDPANKKIVMINKDGKVEKQLINEKFPKVKDLFAIKKTSTAKTVKAQENKVYLLTDTEILLVTLK